MFKIFVRIPSEDAKRSGSWKLKSVGQEYRLGIAISLDPAIRSRSVPHRRVYSDCNLRISTFSRFFPLILSSRASSRVFRETIQIPTEAYKAR